MINKVLICFLYTLTCCTHIEPKQSTVEVQQTSPTTKSTTLSPFLKPATPKRLTKDNYLLFSNRETQDMTNGLHLDDFQKKELSTINNKHYLQLASILDSIKIRQERKQAIDELFIQREAKLQTIFTKEQFENFKVGMIKSQKRSDELVLRLNQQLKEKQLLNKSKESSTK